MSSRGSFERDVHVALKDWQLLALWDTLDAETLTAFKKKILKVSKKCWPQGLQTDGNLAWLYHNHKGFFLVTCQNGRIGLGIIKEIRICSSHTFTTF